MAGVRGRSPTGETVTPNLVGRTAELTINNVLCLSLRQRGCNHAQISCAIPKLNEIVPDAQFGIRIGLDHGPKDKVMWGCYGFTNICEVTATSFHVDVASKLQHAAGRNQIMIGESLRSTLDLHDDLLAVKENEPFVLPNHTLKNGKPHNYRQHVLKWGEYLALSPVASRVTDLLPANSARIRPLVITANTTSGHDRSAVISCGTMVDKGLGICFKVDPPDDLTYPCTIQYFVENHGTEASKHDNYGNHRSAKREVLSESDLRRLPHNDYTQYRGLHYLIAEIQVGGMTTHRGRFGVFIV